MNFTNIFKWKLGLFSSELWWFFFLSACEYSSSKGQKKSQGFGWKQIDDTELMKTQSSLPQVAEHFGCESAEHLYI